MSNTFNTKFHYDETMHEVARIKVVGVGGGGGNAIANMIQKGLNNVEYIALNTDAQALKQNPAGLCIQVGKSITKGLGAGARPEVGREAVEENRHEIEEAIEGADMVFITAGMGGGTGTGGAPVVAGIAKRKGILTVGIVTTPFSIEGKPRMRYATDGVAELKKSCDTVIVIPNERLLDICKDKTMIEAFETANEVLYNATRGISDLILSPGMMNLDFADVRTTMQDGGAAIMGSASASGTDRAEIAAREAINSPLLDGISIRGARNVLVNISGSTSLGLNEVATAGRVIQDEVGDDAEIIMGTVLDESLGDELRITVIATGFELADDQRNGTKLKASPPVSVASTPERIRERTMATPPVAETPAIIRRPENVREPLSADHWRGEKNLKVLDTPTFVRRQDSTESGQPAKEEPAKELKSTPLDMGGLSSPKRFGTGNRLFNNHEERINKGNTDQPAFLRRAMD